MAEFPTLGRETIAQFPSERTLDASALVLQYVGGSEQRFRTKAQPAVRWVIRLVNAPAEDLAALQDFFLEQQGRYGSFSFTDPWDGTVYADCSFESDDFDANSLAEGRSATTLIIRNNQA